MPLPALPTDRPPSPDRDPATLQEWAGALALIATGLEAASQRVEDMHRAIAAKPFGVLARVPVVAEVSAVVRISHDGITHGVHEAIRASARLLGVAAVGLARQAVGAGHGR